MKKHYFLNVWLLTILVTPVFFLLFALPPEAETEAVFLLIGSLFTIYISSLIFAFPAMVLYALILNKVGSSGISEWRKKVILMLCGTALILITVRVAAAILEVENSLTLFLRLPVCYSGIFLLASVLFPLHRKQNVHSAGKTP